MAILARPGGEPIPWDEIERALDDDNVTALIAPAI